MLISVRVRVKLLHAFQPFKNTHVDVESACLAIMNCVPVSGFLSSVMNADDPFRDTVGIPVLESPIQSVFRNSGEERMKMAWRLSSSYLSDSARVSRMDAP